MTYLKIESVDKYFDRGGVRSEVLKDISIDIAQGEVISIIGIRLRQVPRCST